MSLRRMGVGPLDLLQFHWWDYDDNRYLDALKHLADLRDAGQHPPPGADQFRHRAARSVIAEHGIRIVSNQVQYSLVDRRPEVRMAALCRDHDVTLLTYGTLLGGLLSERWLGRPEPGRAELATASLQKYKQMIDAWGGWALFQELLAALEAHRRQARRRASPMSAPATSSTAPRWPASSSAPGSASPSTSPTTPALSTSPSTPTTSPRSTRSSPVARPDDRDRRLRRRVPVKVPRHRTSYRHPGASPE